MSTCKYILSVTVAIATLLTSTVCMGEYFIGPGDIVSIDVIPFTRGFYGYFTVDDSGYIESYYFERIYVNGLTPNELSRQLKELYKTYIIDPVVLVTLARAVNNRYVIIGEVWRPGVYNMTPRLTVVEALAMAGGPMYSALLWDVKVIRGDMNNPQVISVNVSDILKKGDLTTNILLERGDIIYVPRTMIARVNKLLESIAPSFNMIIRGNQLVDIFTE